MSAEPMVNITLRLPDALVMRLDAMVKILTKDPDWTQRGLNNRAHVIREALIRGLTELERQTKK